LRASPAQAGSGSIRAKSAHRASYAVSALRVTIPDAAYHKLLMGSQYIPPILLSDQPPLAILAMAVRRKTADGVTQK